MYDRHLTMSDAKDEMQEQQRQEKIRWWRGLAGKTRWPNSGVYFVLPDNDPEATENEMILKHETGAEIPFRIDDGESMEYIKAFFGEVFPGADVLIPLSARTESRNSVDCNAHDNSRYLARLKGESYSPFTDPMNPPGTNRKSEANHE